MHIGHNAGKKVIMYEAAVREFHKWIMSVKAKNPIEFQPLCVMKAKQEWKIWLDKNFDELWKLPYSMREFFIPSMIQIFLSDLLFRERMRWERGNVVRIGMSFWYGGAYELAKFMNYDNPDIFWVEGDVEKFDKHITDWMLMLYVSAGSRYFDWEHYSKAQCDFLEYLIKTLMYNISHKVVLHLGGFWRFMRGVMYSGGKETSHGDSWVMALLYFLYCVDVSYRYPYAQPFIFECLDDGFLRIVVYGDDFLWCAPKVLRNIINARGFAHFLDTYCGMVLRDYKEYDDFLSVPDQTGHFLKKGPKFLKRYFIATNDDSLAPVLPYKPIDETIIRLLLNENGEPVDYMLSAVGQAWDTQGTNPICYEMIRFFL